MARSHQAIGEPIAIVGSACRFPGDATSPSKLWDLLREPRDVLSEIPESRFNTKAFYHPDGLHHGTSNVRHSYLLSEDHRLFDAQFFGTKPVEANSIDPQQRLLLETVYEGLESAGIPMERLQGSNTGVYVGLMTNDYADLVGRDIQNFPTYFASGTARSILSNRISYFFDWHGPSMTIDTACSSSLIALHQAVQSLRSGETSVAVAAGTNLLLGPEQYVAESKLKMLSPTGRSRMWDKDADGYARGDGIAAVILKTLSAALAAGDHIECLIRETGINQDGRTKGITMPNPIAQADLIRTTYARAGLDLSKPSDRPQYFEAHGTGTPAGDPVEAEAISSAFFGPAADYQRQYGHEPPLYVGSIKTVIGHTEGTAGLAAVLKASLSLQRAIILPNLLLNELSPAVRPFYNDLEIVKVAREWPQLSGGAPRRASVNSFGFGGANAHAILEGFDAPTPINSNTTSAAAVVLPFNFSASSEKSLRASLAAYSAYLKNNENLNLRDLSWTLDCRRSTLPIRLSLSASIANDLSQKLDEAAQSSSEISLANQTSMVNKPKLLGVFTGQGAQWAKMGAELLVTSSLAADCLDRLNQSLQELPVEHRPSWSLREEILKDAASSRIGEAAFSQPLCTAVQIALVELLRAANIQFTAVVGHSSGEIAAAYTAGYLNAEDAIRVAYYRGWSLQHSGGVKGTMMAVATSFEDAQELCEMPELKSRICIAASNSSASVTLSGDADAINEAKDIFEDEKKFTRLLKVDKAYHSHHMQPCASPYIEAVRRCGINIQARLPGSARWISSVYAEDIEDVKDSLADTYWSNNMINPVLFSQAVRYAVGAAGPFDMALEIGPHPALKGPAIQTILEVSGETLPYAGTLNRGQNDREAFASALGALWVSLGAGAVDFAGFESKATCNDHPPKLLKGLPAYTWDHDRIYWHESRISTAFRVGTEEFHPLLGVKCLDGTSQDLRWRNYLHPRELPWLACHQVQGQMVFPATGYISAAVECVLLQYSMDSVQLIDFHDVIIGQALVLEENAGVETIFTLKITESHEGSVNAAFTCYSSANKGSSSMSLHASAHLHVLLGAPKDDLLPPRSGKCDRFLEIESERFYNSVSEFGFGYTGPFRALSDLTRRMDEATGLIAVPANENTEKPLVIHPATLDCAIQSIMLAYSFPGDGQLRTLYLPTKIDRLRINPFACMTLAGPGSELPFHSSVATAQFAELSGGVDLYSADSRHTIVQLQGLHTTPLTPLTPAADVQFFTEVTWGPGGPTGGDFPSGENWSPDNRTLAFDLERLAHFYLKEVNCAILPSERAGIAWYHAHLLSYAEHCVSWVSSGQCPFARAEWANDSHAEIVQILSRHDNCSDVKIMRTVGENLPAVIKGDMSLLEILTHENLLTEFYSNTLGIRYYLQEVARMAGQLSFRYPHMNVLEIGAGAGTTTDLVVREMGTAFSSYMYTDISNGMFDDAQERFHEYQSKMAFKVLDIEKDLGEQGYAENSFDLVIASLSLYATKNLEATLSNTRRLLKPGGYLILLELTDPNVMRFSIVLGGLPGWWLGYDEGRKSSPFVCADRWGELMERTGFSGIEAITPHRSDSPLPFSVMATQAVDSRVKFLREPFAQDTEPLGAGSLTIVGGKTDRTAEMVREIEDAMGRHYSQVNTAASLTDLDLTELPFMGTVISLVELDEPVFKQMTQTALTAFQELFKQSKNVLWVATGAQGEIPYSNMFAGVRRTLVMEMAHLNLQFLNLHSLADADAPLIARNVLQIEMADAWDQNGELDELLWYNEPEMALSNGHLLVPRFRLNTERNDRYNSSRRLIVKEVERDRTNVTLQWSSSGYQVEESNIRELSIYTDRTEIQVTHSILRAVKVTPTHSLFLVIGIDSKSENRVIALSEHLASRIHVPHTWAVRCPHSEELAIRSMMSLYTQFLVQAIVDQVSPGKSLAVLNADFSLAPLLSQRASEKGVQLVLLTTREEARNSPWNFIHPHATKREIIGKLPRDIVKFVNIGGDREVVSILKDCLPPICQIQSEQSLTAEDSRCELYSDAAGVATQLQLAWMRAQNGAAPISMNRIEMLRLSDLIQNPQKPASQFIVDWNCAKLPVQVRPASAQVKFGKDKSYWLVGLTGGLGLSLCQWMARQGARYIALSSRNPKIDNEWLRQMAAEGCTIRVFANDITNRESLYATYHQICESMPPIAGVAQGAMVLQDTMFPDLDLARLEKVLRPKVEGSILLDELFSSNTLDFFIFFSSMASMTGNPGQVAYNAANMFMASLAAQRRARGLTGQAINIGAVVGNGYVTRELNLSQQTYLYRVGHSWMSEQDFHEVFAEGVFSCLNPTASAELCCGLRIDDDDTKAWVSNPMFQHLVFKSNSLITDDKRGKAGVMVKTQLLEATSQEQVNEILQDAFVLKLQSALQADPSTLLLDSSPDELGVDSLVAVDLRSWFLKELGVDMPVLKIFNAASIRELLSAAAEILPQTLIPNVKEEVQHEHECAQPLDATQPSAASNSDENEEHSLEPSSLAADRIETLNLPYLKSTNAYSGSSAPSLKAGDSNSERNEDTASSISIDESVAVPAKRNVQRTLPMSFGQSRFWFLKFFVEDQTAFNITSSLRLTGQLRIPDFAKAVEAVGQRHEALRTFFFTDDGKRHMQGVWDSSILRLEHFHIIDEKEVEDAAKRMRSHVFDLSQGEILRIQLLSLTSERHWAVLGFHHINMDGISFENFWADIERAYEGTPPVKDMLQYPDFTLRQLREYEEGAWADDLKYWRKQFPWLPSPIPLLPFSRQSAHPGVSQFGAHTTRVRIDQRISEKIEKCCRMFKTSPFHFYLAVWEILLLRHFGLDSICIGVGDGNRRDGDVLNTIGLFLNLLPIPFNQKQGQSFGEALKDARLVTQNAFTHSRVPFDVILDDLKVPRSASLSPLFQVFFNYRQKIQESRTLCGCLAEGDVSGLGEHSYDLTLDVADISTGESLVFLSVQKDLYELKHAEILLRSYCNLLRSFAENPATRVTWPGLFSQEDVEIAVAAGRGSETESLWPATVVHRVDDIALSYPHRVALKDEDGTELTYVQMQNRVNVIANQLLSNGVGPSTGVGILQSPTADLVCSLMAILRVGGVYIPLDRKVGRDRLTAILKDSRPRVILIDASTSGDAALLPRVAELIDVASLTGVAVSAAPNMAASAQTAVIIYTSGSTGTPKAIRLSHLAYLHNIQWSTSQWEVQEGEETILHQSAYAFDMSLLQIFASLCIGGTLVIASSLTRGDPVAISTLIASEKVTFTCGTPAEYLGWLQHGRSTLRKSQLRTAICGGEALSNGLIFEFRSLAKYDLRLINAYGPAETTLACSSGIVPYKEMDLTSVAAETSVYSLSNYSIYIVDAKLNPVPIGLPGEVMIGGVGVAQGYVNKEDTKERFLPDKYSSPFFQAHGWTTVHRTGDRGRLNPDGGLVLQGRIADDTQIKLGGIRMDLEEIEAAIVHVSEGHISQAVISPRQKFEDTSSEKFLVAFVMVSSQNPPANQADFLKRLAVKLPLPQYMRPAAVIPIDRIPQTTSNKIDRPAVNRLPIPKTSSEHTKDTRLTPAERSLYRLWEEVLPQELTQHRSIEASSDFFHVGGSSLTLVNLQALVKDRLGVSIPLYRLFEASTLRGMAACIDNESIPDSQTTVDWEKEVQLAADLDQLLLQIDAPIAPSGARVVALTGATGFLGKELLQQLVEDDKVITVHCLAVRRTIAQLPTAFSHEKVIVHPGDLMAPQLGLSDSDATSIFSQADVIIHNGADVSFMKSYQSLKLANVASTKELVKLALPRHIPFHFISSASVARLAKQDSFGELSVALYPPPSVPRDGYTAAKWVSEVYLERVSQHFGLPVWIHRPSSVTGPDAPELDLMSNLFQYTQKMKAIPDSGSWSGIFDFISVQSAAGQILDAVHSSNGSETGATGVRYLYESGEIQVGQYEVQLLMESGTGEQFEVIPVTEWVDRAEKAGMSGLLGTYLHKASGGEVLLPRLIKGKEQV